VTGRAPDALRWQLGKRWPQRFHGDRKLEPHE
jgi:hypothetical protein